MIVSCPSCGRGNPPWARRCAKCGASLDELPDPGLPVPDGKAGEPARPVSAPPQSTIVAPRAEPPQPRLPEIEPPPAEPPSPLLPDIEPPPTEAPAPRLPEFEPPAAEPARHPAPLAELLSRPVRFDDALSRLAPPETVEPRLPDSFEDEDSWRDMPRAERPPEIAEPSLETISASQAPPEAPEPKFTDPDAAVPRRKAPTAAIELPPRRRNLHWLAVLAILVVLAAGIGAFLAVWMSAPERGAAGLDFSEIADRVRQRLAEWGLTAR